VTFPVVLDAVARVLREAGLLTELRGDADTEVSGVAHDSRAVRRGDLFLAWKGILADGHDFAPAAAAAGATAMVVERALPEIELPQLVVSDGRHAAALAADAVMGLPGRDLNAVAVTGTNGKTTTALLTRHVLATRPEGAAAVGTLGVVGPLDQYRLDAIPFRVAVFTNLSRDHLDYHGSLEAYRASKLRLLELLRDDGTVVVNAADPAWRGIDAPSLLTYAVREPADLRAENVVLSPRGTRFTLHFRDEAVPVSLPLLGSFNVENALAAIGAGLALGVPLEAAARRLEDAPQIPGRMERILETPFTVVVDFAHTPDALENLLRAVRAVTQGRLVVLFGAGGDRDRGKREPMAQAVARHADRIFLTSDNPRTEDPERILDDLEPGLGQADHVREADRRSAIRQAVAEAMEGDVLVLAGKGHETYQVIGTEKHPFDERAEVMEALKLRGAA
jgi:UDP-N-acetylmuramoyl-L-alanyl-D-glutamate--2,6-diaminopimelate ligase